MINALRGLGHNQFERALWAPDGYEKYKIIRAEVVSEDSKRWNNVIQNLITSADSLLLRTSDIYPYAPRQHVKFRDVWYEIVSANMMTTEVNPQVLSLVKNGNPQWLLELKEVDGYDVE